MGETHSGQIKPNTEAGVAELAAESTSEYKLEMRDRDPSLQICKFDARVETADDGITVLTGSDGQPILPDPSTMSSYFVAVELIGEATTYEIKKRVGQGNKFVRLCASMKEENDAVTTQEVLDAFIASNGPSNGPRNMIICDGDLDSLREVATSKADLDMLLGGAIIASNTKLSSLVQKRISMKSINNPGRDLPNPITRIKIGFNKTTGVPDAMIHDKSKSFKTAEGKVRYEQGKVDGELVNADNVHKFIQPRTTVDGIAVMDCVCLSSMGISVPVKLKVVVAKQPEPRHEIGIDDLYDDDENETAPAPAAPPTTTVAASSTVDAHDMTAMLASLSDE